MKISHEKLKKRLGIGEAGSVETVSEKKREDYAKKPARRSELIRQALEESGAPVSYEEVERYLKEKAAVGEIDNDSSWPFAVRERFDADVRKSVTAVANEIADKLI